MDQILHTDDSHLAQLGLDNLVGGDGGAVAVNLRTKYVWMLRYLNFKMNTS